MAKGIDIGIGADTRAFEQGIKKGLIDPLEDAQDALEKVGKGGDVDKLETQFRGAQRVTKDLNDEIKDTTKAIKNAGKSDFGKDYKNEIGQAEDGLHDFKDEANSTAREAAASFDGSAESIGDAFQEVAANAFAGFGPAGAIAGLAAAAGIGLVIASFQAADERAKESEERANEWAQAFIDAGSRILDATAITSRASDILTDPDKYKKAQESAELWGTSVSTAILAMAGDAGSLQVVDDAVTGLRESAQAMANTYEGELTPAQIDQIANASKAGEAYRGLSGEMEVGRQKADIYSQMLVNLAATTQGATTKVDEFGDTVVTLPDGKQVYIDAETGQATDNVDRIEKKVFGLPDGNIKVTATVDDAPVNAALARWRSSVIKIPVTAQVMGSGGRFMIP